MKVNKILLNSAIFSCLVGLCVYPAESKHAVVTALQVCGCSVIPALFPFFVLTKLLTANLSPVRLPKFLDRAMEVTFGVSGACLSPLLMSFLGGYPVGVSGVISLYEEGTVTKNEAERALLFCNNSGPAFFIGVVGSVVLGSVKAGLLLYLLHVVSALLVGRIFSGSGVKKVNVRRLPEKPEPISRQFLNAISNSCTALLQICGLVLFFSVFLSLLERTGLISLLQNLPLGLSEAELSAALYGTLELTGGILRLSSIAAPLVPAAFFMGWGGFCVHFQAMSLWQKVNLYPKGYFLAKLLHGTLSALLASCCLSPNLVNLCLLILVAALSVFIPKIRKKSGRNPLRNAV